MKSKNLTQLKKEIYLRNVAKRWKSELITDKQVYIFSPYITSKTAENVVENARKCEIYTDFNVENFVFGSSSLTTLKKLVKKGFKVYSISQLHAKIILVSGTFVSIGSQNLTNRGTLNKEATFTSNNIEIVKFVEKEFKEKWFVNRIAISLRMIEDLEGKLRPLKTLYKKLKKNAEEAKEFVDEQERQRETELQRKIEYKKKLTRLRAKLIEINKTQTFIKGITDVIWSEYSSVCTFVPNSKYGSNLLNWRINSTPYKLDKSYRYLSLIKNTGKLGWARVMKTRITYFGNSIKINQPIELDGKKYSLSFFANWESKTLSDYNLIISLRGLTMMDILSHWEVDCWFDLDSFEIFEIKSSALASSELKDWISKNSNHFKEAIIKNLMPPFKYAKNLSGEEADKFLGKWMKFKLEIGEISNQPFLIFSST